jgi:hypothetical protein
MIVITEAMKREGWRVVDDLAVAPQVSDARKRELNEALVSAFIAIGHTPEMARIAARGPEGDDVLTAFALVESQADDPLSELGPLSEEFQAGLSVLTKAGFRVVACLTENKENSFARFSKKGLHDIYLKQDGSWTVTGTTQHGTNAFQLGLMIL